MFAFGSDRRFWFAVAFLMLNAAGWWWVKSEAGKRGGDPGSPAARAEGANVAADGAPAAAARLTLKTAEQAALSPERELTLALSFSGPVEWPTLERRLSLRTGGGALGWRFEGTPSGSSCRVRTLAPVAADRVEVALAAGVASTSRDWAPTAEPFSRAVAVVPAFRFFRLETETPAFGQPLVVAHFTQAADARQAAAAVACEPPVAFTVTPGPWGNGLRLNGPFEPGRAYTFTFKQGLRSREGHRLEQEARRTLVIRHREPSVTVPVEGRYLAPEGALAVPVLAVNTPVVVSELTRVLPQNLVQYALREAGLSTSWWSDEPAELAQELGVRATVRTNAVTAARDREQRLLLRLEEHAGAGARGVYVLKVGGPKARSSSRLVCVTDLGLSARVAGREVTAWVTTLRTGAPAAGVRVELYARNNLKLDAARSDAAGLVRLSGWEGQEGPFLLVAHGADGDLSVLPLTAEHGVAGQAGAARGYLAPGACEAFVMSDRDLYRHGETVFVQALLRRADGTPPPPFPLALHVVKPDGRTFKTLPLLADELGAVTAELALPEYLPSGAYAFELRLPGEGAARLGAHRVRLESFVPPQVRVRLLEAPAQARAGEELSFAVAAEHLFGKPAAGLRAEASLTLAPAAFAPAGWEGFVFGDAERILMASRHQLGRQTLGPDGRAGFTARAAWEGLAPARMAATLQATVTETGGRAVSASAQLMVDPCPYYIGVRPVRGALARPGAPVELRLAAVRPDGERHAGRVPLRVRVEQVTWVSGMLRTPEGRYRWESKRVKTPVSEGEAAIDGPDAAYRLTVEAAGEYLATFSDPATGAATSWRFAAGAEAQETVAWDRSRPDRVELVFDRPSYRPGERARLQLRAPFAGQAWVALCGAGVLENRVLALTNNTATLEWEVTEAMAPGVTVSAGVVRPAVAESVWSAHRASGEALLRVLPPERRLTVAVEAGAEAWRPRAAGEVRVAVTDASGRPAANARVTVLAVDEGICHLTGYETPDPYGFFLAPRAGEIGFYDIYRRLMPIADERLFGTASHAGGGGDAELLKRLNPVAARRFKPLALWRANLQTDAAGRVAVPFELPEFAGELRLTAVAWDARAVGAGAAAVKVRRRLVVQPDLPRFLAPGDRAEVRVALHNESGAACTARVTVAAEGPAACDAAPREAALAAGASLTLAVPVEARAAAGRARLTVRVEGAGETYEEPVELAVRPTAGLRTADAYRVVEPGGAWTFEAPEGLLAGSAGQSLFCAAQPAVNLLGALDYVTHYPYGCLEQTVSAALPLLALSGLEGRLPSRESTLALEAPARVDAALLRVLSMQRWNGFAMWPETWAAHPAAGVYATLFLAQAERAGHALPKGALAEALWALRSQLSDDDNEALRAYICHVLALAGQPDLGWQLRLEEQAESLAPEARYHLARALLRSGEAERGRALLERTRAVKGLREAAFGLLAWLEVEPAGAGAAACCREIERARRREGHWGSTQDNALALLALGAYLRATPERPGLFTPAAAWGGGRTLAAAATNAWTWTADAASAGGAVRLSNAGPGPMHVVRRVWGVPADAAAAPADSGLKVRREWLDTQGLPLAPGALEAGDTLVVRLTLDPLGRRLEDVVVEELLPAGLEIEQASAAQAGTLPWIRADEAGWVLHREARDDRLLLFSRPFSEPVRFHYVARAVSAGEFAVPAAAAAAMYEPDTFSRHGGGRVTVR